MLDRYETIYRSIAGAPRASVTSAVQSTLKSETVMGEMYDDREKELMRWYNYLFLNRGKPSTHIMALSELSNDEFETSIPDVLSRLLDNVRSKLAEDNSSISL